MATEIDPNFRSREGFPRIRGLLIVLAVGAAGPGCGREFFRQWADQDVSEGVFEKSRDPRWRLDMFSIEPPATARYADAYDVDRLPAPPDDHATEALGPVPQWPHHRLLTPVEGTGYLDVMEKWMRERPNLEPRPSLMNPPGDVQPDTTPPPPSTGSPFQPGGNPGTTAPGTTPIPSTAPNSPKPPTVNPAPTVPGALPPQARAKTPKTQDSGVLKARNQVPADDDYRKEGLPLGPKRMQTPAAVDPLTGLKPENYKPQSGEEAGAVGSLEADVKSFDEAEAAGLPPGSRPYIVNPAQAVTLSLVNGRVYQSYLEQVYIAGLASALQRFNLSPQVFAGQNPNGVLPTAGGPTTNPLNVFNYATRGTGSQSSGLSLGEVAGIGKVFSYGTRLVGSFANSTVFNFLAPNSKEPVVRSYLPLTLTQPFLRGGGRAVTLEGLTQAERNLVYAVRNLARFRQQWIPYIIGSSASGALGGTALVSGDPGNSTDPVIGYLNVIQQLQDIENDRRTVAVFQKILVQFKQSLGSGSGISPLQVNTIDSNLQSILQTLINDELQYRNVLDGFKLQIGLPPDVPMILDRAPLAPIRKVFDDIERWSDQPDEKRETADLAIFLKGLPKLPDVVIDGRPVVEYYANPAIREDVNLAGERVALENRLDLMNNRAALYDTWRQIMVAANGLKGVFNVTLTNTFLTPPTTTNPFGFVDNSKQFSLVLNTELPLIRVADRNTYRTTIINYRRNQRLLMSQEDDVKLAIRQEIRNLVLLAETYEIQRRLLEVSILQRDNSLRTINAPPQGANVDTSALINTNVQTLTQGQNTLRTAQTSLITTWVGYITQRLYLYRDLGTIPYDEWEAYYEFFAPDSGVNAGGTGTDSGSPPAGAPRGGAGTPAARRP